MADGHCDVTSTWTDLFCFFVAISQEVSLVACGYKLVAVVVGKGRQAGRQAAPTCYMDRSKDHRISLDRSNSFLHPSCPY